jgi:hypothetical protein
MMVLLAAALLQGTGPLVEFQPAFARTVQARALVSRRLDRGEKLNSEEVGAVGGLMDLTSKLWTTCMIKRAPPVAGMKLDDNASADEILRQCVVYQAEFIEWFKLQERVSGGHSPVQLQQMIDGMLRLGRSRAIREVQAARQRP